MNDVEKRLKELISAVRRAKTPEALNTLKEQVGQLFAQLGPWEVAHLLQGQPEERRAETQEFLAYLERTGPALAQPVELLLEAVAAKNRELMAEFGGD